MPQRWRYMRNGQECGPVTTADLRLLADAEQLQATDLVRGEGKSKWVEAGSVRGLFYYGKGNKQRSGGRVAVWVGAVAVLLLLLGVGAGVLGYYLHWFGGAAPTPDPAPAPTAATPTPAPDPGPVTLDKNGGTTDDSDWSDPETEISRGPRVHHERDRWRSSHGQFVNTKGDRWVEKYDKATFRYMETARTNEYVELFDKGRNFTVRLFADHYEVKVGNRFERRLEGKWVES